MFAGISLRVQWTAHPQAQVPKLGRGSEHWTTSDYADMLHKPLEFTAIDVKLIRRGQAKRAAEGCMLARGTHDSRTAQAVPEWKRRHLGAPPDARPPLRIGDGKLWL
jgi:hypothetical protein